MLKLNKKLSIIFFTAIFGCFGAAFLTAHASTFNPDFIISDEELLDNTTMTMEDIKEFLRNRGSYLAAYRTRNADGEMKWAAEIIYDAANNNWDCSEVKNLSEHPDLAEKKLKCQPVKINPRFLLVLLQKEQGLIDDPSPKQGQLDWATGYGCPDNQACNPHWKGFGKQVNSASLQFFDYLANPQDYTYKAGRTYTVSNTGRSDSIITPANRATAALYNYTPHVYWGNYNFYRIWLRYFTFNYPNGSLLQVKGEPGVWLIQNGKKRPFLTKGALTSRFDVKKIIQVNKSELARYPKGVPIKFPQYSLIRSPRGTIFLLVDNKRRGFASAEAFRKIGYNPAEIINASWEDINAYEEGIPITATSSYPTGALLQDKTTGGVYWVSEGTKAPLWDAVLLKTKFKGKVIIPESPEKLAQFKTVEPAIFNDGELIKSSISPAVYVVDNYKVRPITSGKIFEALGYKWENIITVPIKILNLYEKGEPISEIYAENNDENATSTDRELENEINEVLNP